jgi:type IV secretory pathway component VirB8
MAGKLKDILVDNEKKARLLFWVWIISMAMLVIGYIIIFYVLFQKK